MIRARPAAYLAALLLAAMAVALRLAVNDLVSGVQFITLFPAVIAAAYLFGVGPAVATALLGGLGAWYFFVPPVLSFELKSAGELVSLLAYFLVAVAIAIGVGGFRNASFRLRAVVEQMPIGVIIARVPDGEILIYNRSAERLLGHPVRGADVKTYGEYGGFHPDGTPLAPDEYPTARAVLKGETVRDEEISYRRGDGVLTTLLVSAQPIAGRRGGGELVVCTFTDISERKEQELRQRLLIDELNHRVKNTLAIVQSLAQQTLKSRNVDISVRRDFEGRLMALSSAHDVLTSKGWSPACIEVVFTNGRDMLGIEESRVRLSGPTVRVPPKMAVSLAMAFHELATNAIKYGSLSVPEGGVDLSWTLDAGNIEILWRETGGPAVAAPPQRGFGSRLIERALAADLKGQARLDFRPEGLVCTIVAPLPGGEG